MADRPASHSAGHRSAWLPTQTRASRVYFTVVLSLGAVAFLAAAFLPGWRGISWTVGGWTLLGVLASFSVALQLRKVADGSGTVTLRDVWSLAALFIWGLPAALLVNLALTTWSETVTKVRLEGRVFVPARLAFNTSISTLALVAAWAVTLAGDRSPIFCVVAGLVFELVTALAVELHLLTNASRRRAVKPLLFLAAMCLTEVPLAVALSMTFEKDAVIAALLAFPVFVAAAGLQYILEFIELRDLVSTDSRTGLLTPVAWREAAERLLRSQQVAILMADLDHFKQLNDTYGHLVGDEVLKQVGDVLISSIRPMDLACRWGGEEFVLVLPETSVRDAALVAERIRARVQDEVHGSGADVTISIGVAGCQPGMSSPNSLTSAMTLADEALYQAKRDGRNRVAATWVEVG